jgi:hypothetical protein
VSRVQRAAAEGCGIPEIRERAWAYENREHLEPGGYKERMREFAAWLDR